MKTPTEIVKFSVFYALVVSTVVIGALVSLGLAILIVTLAGVALWIMSWPQSEILELDDDTEDEVQLSEEELQAVRHTLLRIADAQKISVKTLLILYGGFKELNEQDSSKKLDELAVKLAYRIKEKGPNHIPACLLAGSTVAECPENNPSKPR